MTIGLYLIDKSLTTPTTQVWARMFLIQRPRDDKGEKVSMEIYNHLVGHRMQELMKIYETDRVLKRNGGPAQITYNLVGKTWKRQGKNKKTPSKLKSHPKQDKKKA